MFINKKQRSTAFDYSFPGLYFITICTKNKKHYFGHINNGELRLNKFGLLANNRWLQLPEFFCGIKLYDFIIMPNHMHGIIQIKDTENVLSGRKYDPANIKTDKRVQKVPVIISSYKSGVTREINKIIGENSFGWQPSFYDRVIRNEEEFEAISLYIIKNPLNWKNDIEYGDYKRKSEEKINASEIFKYYDEIVNGKFKYTE